MEATAAELRRVETGLRFVFLGLVAVVIDLGAVVGIAFTIAPKGNDPTAIMIGLTQDHPMAVTILLGLSVLAQVLTITGQAHCLAVPADSGAWPFLVASLAFSVTSLVLGILSNVPELVRDFGESGGAGPFFAFGGFLLFVRFLRRLAIYLKVPRPAERARIILVASTALLVTFLIAALSVAAGITGAAFAVVSLVMLLGGFAILVLYLSLVIEIRRVVAAAAEGAGD